MAVNLLWQISFPTVVYALTGGPSQPEMESFEPVGTTEMVDLFTGDFNYNIPLMDVGGYPINIAYHSGVTMDQEASWTGLGWNINAGVISRAMRGLPDDFNKDAVHTETNVRDNINWSLFTSGSIEFMGLGFSLGSSIGMTQNNYRGRGYFVGSSFSIPNVPVKIGYTTSSEGGFEYDVSMSARVKNKNEDKEHTIGIGTGFSSRGGMKELTIGYTRSKLRMVQSQSAPPTGNADGQPVSMQPSYQMVPGRNYSVGIPTSPTSALPTLSQSFNTYAQNYNLTIGGEVYGLHLNGRLGGTYSRTELQKGDIGRQAFGYLYEQNSGSNDDAVHDFSKERDGTLNRYIKNLPLSAPSYDIFSVSGQGTGGMFRPHRNNTGIYYDNLNSNNTSNLAAVGVEIGFGNLVHVGVDWTPTVATEKTGPWTSGEGNALRLNRQFQSVRFSGRAADPVFEQTYFKAGGEKTPVDSLYHAQIGGEGAVRFDINRGPGASLYASLENTLENDHGAQGQFPDLISGNKRQARSQYIGTLTADQAANSGVGFHPQLRSYPWDYYEQLTPAYSTIDRLSSTQAKSSHIGEITQTNQDGTRYVYAIPAYNNVQHEVSFNVPETPQFTAKGLVRYAPGEDNTRNNQQGQDHYFNKVTLPGYAHSYLLTAVLSADYVDADDVPGPSQGDMGQYVVFHYNRHNSGYQWRVPCEKNMAQFQDGLKSDKNDDRGNYIYGTKEIWYLQSIESRTHIAEFKTSPRFDGLGVLDENGGADTAQYLMKLDTIVLYSLPDLLKNKANATPLKKVVFEYDYSLCKHVSNHKYYNTNVQADSTGKLTLKKLYFMYGTSNKGAMSPYTFTYDTDNNPDYDMSAYDRWGYHKQNNEQLPNRDYPYVQQYDKAQADRDASAWLLKQVNLPSGGTIAATYEADDYAFVQDRRAMQMVKIIAATDDIEHFSLKDRDNNRLFKNRGNLRRKHLVFRLPPGVNAGNLWERCFGGIGKLYFKFYVNIKGHYEYVQGWCNIDEAGMVPGNSSLGYVKVGEAEQDDWTHPHDAVHPVSKTAWQFATVHMSKFLHPGSDPNGTSTSAFEGLLGAFGEALDMFRGANQVLKIDGVADEFDTNRSWIRIGHASGFKYGGGGRIRQLTFSDSWNSMDQADRTAQYGQTYDYTLDDPTYGLISSGVASYEPMIGGEENPFRKPVPYYEETNITLPRLQQYHEEPFGETFFPAPVIGYSKVTVKNIVKPGVKRTGTGRTEYAFYTARDFPVITQQTTLHPESLGDGKLGSIISSLLKVVSLSYYAATQGYMIKLNDMHGKPRSITMFSEMSDVLTKAPVVSKTEYTYKTKNGELDNHVKVLTSTGAIREMEIGKETDMSVHMRQNEREEINGGLQVNVNVNMAGPVPITYAIPWPTFHYSMHRSQSASVTKIIQQYGVLESVTTQNEGSIMTTKNLLYDQETGQVLLTQTANVYDDPLYQFKYPAYLAYDGMGPAYKNAGMRQNLSISFGSATVAKGLYTEGDELVLENSGAYQRAWVLKVTSSSSTDEIFIVDEDGSAIASNTYAAFISRSGRRNMTEPDVGMITTTVNPMQGSTIAFASGIAQVTANTFSDRWRKQLDKVPDDVVTTCNYTADTFVTELFNLLMGRVHAQRSGPHGVLPYNMENTPGFHSSNFFHKMLSGYPCLSETWGGDSVFMTINDSSLSPHDTWADTDSIAMVFFADCDMTTPAHIIGSLVIYDTTGCQFSDIDTILSLVPNEVSAYTSGVATARMLNGDTCHFIYTNASASGFFDVYNGRLEHCVSYTPCKYVQGNVFNPYVKGVKGVWRPYQSMSFFDKRAYTYKGDTTFIRKDGLMGDSAVYWLFNSTSKLKARTYDKRWITASTVTNYSNTGKPVEAADALNNYTAELYGYNENFVTASASDAKLKEIANDNFETYGTGDLDENECQQEPHFSFLHGTNSSGADVEISTDHAHTGVQSLGLCMGARRSVTHYVDTAVVEKVSGGTLYREANVADALPVFSPDKGKKYVLSAWVKCRASDVNKVNTFDSAWVRIQTSGTGAINSVFKASGPVIDGWQRIEGTFTVPQGATYITVSLENRSASKAYFDDIRLHPFVSNMKTFVYHPLNQKVMAILDENNFASYYEYDQEGKLIRVKKETERGIMTIKESRGSYTKGLQP